MVQPCVLVIEDDATLVRIITDLLTDEGYRVRTGSNGQGLALAMLEPPDLILLDLFMPGMDGMTVRRHLLEFEPTAAIPVVLMTAQANSRKWGRDLQCQAQLDKPFLLQELLDTVRQFAPLPEPVHKGEKPSV